MTDVVIVGAGLAGLETARRLAERDRDVTVFERNDAVGGRVRSRTVDGFVLDRGFQVLFTAYPAVQEAIDLGPLELRSFPPGATIARDGERSSLGDPLGDPGALPATLLSGEAKLGDKLRMLRLRRSLGRRSFEDLATPSERTIAEYLAEAGFSRRVRSAFFEPLFGGITLDRSLSTTSAIFEYCFRALAIGRSAVPAAGMGEIPAQIADRARAAGARIELETPVDGLSGHEDGATVDTATETLSPSAAVVATDPETAASLTGLDAVRTEMRGCVTQHFALPDTQDLHVRHPLILNADGPRPNHVAVMSDAAPELAPEGRQLLSATVLGVPDATDEDLARSTRTALDSWFPENRFEALELLATDRIPAAQPVQPPGALGATPAVDAPEGAVFLAGDHTTWGSIQGALQSGARAAAAVDGS